MTDRPRFMAFAAVTLDGRIARNSQHATTWTSPEDKIILRQHLDESDRLVVGRATYDTSREALAKRPCLVFTRSVTETIEQTPFLTLVNPATTDPVRWLTAVGVRQVAVLGGTETYTYFFDRDYIDELYLTIEPISFGEGLPLHRATRGKRQARLVNSQQLNERGTMLLHYRYES